MEQPATHHHKPKVNPTTAKFKENLYIGIGLVTMAIWLVLFLAGLLVESSYYRVALNYGFWEWKDWVGALLTFTVTNVALLAFLAGLIGGICSKVIHTDGFKLSEEELIGNKVDYILFENPVISAFRGVFMFLTILSIQYLSSFSDMSSINTTNTATEGKEVIHDKELFVSLLQTAQNDTAKQNEIKNLWNAAEKKDKTPDVETLISKVILYRDSLKNHPKATPEQISYWTEQMRSLRKSLKVPPLVDIPGITLASYFKFAVLVSLLSFICGYDPYRFNLIMSRFPLFNKKDGDTPQT